MDLQQFKYFIVVAEKLHFRQAAEQLYVTQSALSQQIANLEAELGLELFVRQNRTVNLTKPGKKLFIGAKKLWKEYEKLIDTLNSERTDLKKSIKIGHSDYQNLTFIRQVLKLFSKNQAMNVESVHTNIVEVERDVKSGKIDIGIGFLPAKNPTLMVMPLMKGHWCVVLPKEHYLSAEKKIHLRQLNEVPLVLFSKSVNANLHDKITTYFKKNNLHLNIAYQTSQSAQGIDLVSQEIGLFIMASYVHKNLPGTLKAIPLDGISDEITLGALWRKKSETIIRPVLNELKKQAQF